MAVIDNQFETKGTHLFFIDTVTTTDPTVVKLTCPTGIPGIAGGTKDRIDTTCLDETGDSRTSIDGFGDPEDVVVPFILYKGDVSHQALFEMKRLGRSTSWMVGLSDSTAYPTLDSDMTALVTPIDRTTFAFNGSVAAVTVGAEINDVVRGSLTLRVSGSTTPHWAA